MISTNEFFAADLEGRLSAMMDVGGIIKIDVEDESNGIWFVDLDNGTISQEDCRPSIIVRGNWRDLLAFMQGKMSAEDGLLTERLELAGEVNHIAKLAAALAAQHQAAIAAAR